MSVYSRGIQHVYLPEGAVPQKGIQGIQPPLRAGTKIIGSFTYTVPTAAPSGVAVTAQTVVSRGL